MIKSKKLTKFKNLKHGFFNSIGGHSKKIYKSLNCGPGSLDNEINVKKNIQVVRKKISNKAKNIFSFLLIFFLTICKFFLIFFLLSLEPGPQFKLL